MKKTQSASRKFEREAVQQGSSCVIGVDEAGRGPLAGPVVAAACFVPLDCHIDGIQDSKAVSEDDRELLYKTLTSSDSIYYSVAIRSVEYIDEHNILAATLDAMAECATAVRDQLQENLASCPLVAVDGNRLPPKLKDCEPLTVEAVVKGDSKVFAIAAASIIAKVVRDRMMHELDLIYPEFDLKKNKGYPTPAHKKLVVSLGPTPHHRLSFAPIGDLLRSGKLALPSGRSMPVSKKKVSRAKGKENNDMDGDDANVLFGGMPVTVKKAVQPKKEIARAKCDGDLNSGDENALYVETAFGNTPEASRKKAMKGKSVLVKRKRVDCDENKDGFKKLKLERMNGKTTIKVE